ncbi:MAG TPA: glycosyl hydrolase 115 family protein [Gemmatimonadaceae bacterium]|nr:glycosyl hydrolase 115 family protein [Gemmatimonadaceae bacterium]
MRTILPRTPRVALALAAALAVGATTISCAGRTTSTRRSVDRNYLSEVELRENNFITAYDAVAALRGNWLRERGSDSFTSPTYVQVYLDSNRMGGVESLRQISVRDITSIRYLDGVQGVQRYGIGHGQGVIVVSTIKPEGSADQRRREPETSLRSVPGPMMHLAANGGTAAGPDDADSYVTTRATGGSFALAVGGRAVPVWVSGADWPGVVRVARDLQADLGRVTGAAPALALDSLPRASRAVLVGTIGRSPVIDRLVRERKLDTSRVAGRWETFVLQVVRDPAPGIEQALVIAGSDKRGTIYGTYDLSEQIGVSPWYWWADVPVARRAELHVKPGRHTRGTPAVKYRGIFINDEAPAMSGWTREKFGGFNHRMYTHMFELILRMKGNFLWPAMWGNAFADDDSLNAKLADEYGIVVSTSHHEPMTRAHAEWQKYHRGVAWDYTKSDSTLREFWRQGIRRNGSREHVVTLGMRGDGDAPMTEGTAISLLETIVKDQRAIIGEVTGKPAEQTPQVWALYKEVQDYYDKGMRVPDDVTLLFADDNWGNIRRLPTAKDRDRAGGFGVYYHFDYVGGPRNYKWLNTNPIARVWEQMHLAHELGANRIWVVNVGDLKPMEFPIDFFLDYAWNPSAIPAEALPDWTRRWAEQQFGQGPTADGRRLSSEIADLVTTSLKYLGRRKPELLDTATYSLTNWREAERVVEDWRALEARALRVRDALPATHRDAYYQLVLHPIQGAGNLHDLYVTVAKNRQYALQGRASTNALAERARRLFARDAEISRFYNDTLAAGKWSHMMDQTHIGYTYWQQPERDVMPRVDIIHVPAASEMGVAVVELNRPAPQRRPGQGGPPPGFFGRPLELPAFDPFLQQTWHVDVFARGSQPVDFTATAGEPWVTVTPSRGTVTADQRLAVRVDWAKAPVGTHRVPITITGPNDLRVVVQAPVFNPASPRPESVVGFVQGNGVVSMEAEHAARVVNGGGARWQRIPDLGRTLSAMTILPTTVAPQTPGTATSPRLEYDVVLFDSGAVKVHTYVSPTHDVLGQGGMKFAVSFDDEAPRVVNLHADGFSSGRTDGNTAWEQGVANNIRVLVTEHRLAKPGAHILKVWAIDPGVVVQKVVIATGELPPTYLGPPESFNRALQPRAPAVRPTATSMWSGQ